MILRKLKTVIFHQPQQIVRHASMFKSLFNFERNTPPYNHIVQIGDPVLREVSDPVPPECIQSKEVQLLINQMRKVLNDYSLVGLACPQIGISLRIFVMQVTEKAKKKNTPEIWKAKEMELLPFTVIINPEIEVLDHKKIIYEESCASIIGFAAEIPRNYSVKVKALNEEGNEVNYTFKGWNARIAQHENDHLNGILFTDIMDRKTLRCTNWQVVNAKGGRIEVPYYAQK